MNAAFYRRSPQTNENARWERGSNTDPTISRRGGGSALPLGPWGWRLLSNFPMHYKRGCVTSGSVVRYEYFILMIQNENK